MIELECRPFTQNHKSVDSKRDQLMKVMSAYRQAEIASIRSNAGDPFGKLHTINEYQSELAVISNVLAYLNVAYLRFADHVPMKLDQKFQVPLAQGIPALLLERLLSGEGAEERCQKYMEASPEVVKQRDDLRKKLDILQVTADILESVSCNRS